MAPRTYRPTNTYYAMPNYRRILGAYAITGLFACAHIYPPHPPSPHATLLWINYFVTLVVLLLMNPFLCFERTMINEDAGEGCGQGSVDMVSVL